MSYYYAAVINIHLCYTTYMVDYFVYVAQCKDGSYYCGYTTDVTQREQTHNTGKGAKYTASRLPVKIVYSEAYSSKSNALKREWEIKKMTRLQKIELIKTVKVNVKKG